MQDNTDNANYEERVDTQQNQNMDSSNIELIIQKLEEERKEATKNSNYSDAEQLRLKIEELRSALDIAKKRDLTSKHQAEMLSLKSLYQKEVEEIDERFNQKFLELENKSKEQEEKLNIKHQSEMEDLYNLLDAKLPKVVKYSKKYLDMKNQEQNLAKQQKYKDAELIKKKCEEIDKIDTDKFNKEKTEKIKSQSIKTANKHLNEKNALKKKLELEYDELKRDRQIATHTSMLRYNNKKAELENQQKMETQIVADKNKLKKSNFYLNSK